MRLRHSSIARRYTYGQRAGTFLSNAGVLQVFGVNDHDSARLVSDLLGQETVVFQTLSRALDAEASGITLGEQHVGRPLLTSDEVRNMPQDGELLFLAGQRPVLARKLRYYADREFTGLFDPPDVSVPTSNFAPHRALTR
ncbi:type IV secretory system conjugative DNA transfer family protein [Methylobacterium nonmethylotrophicum]|uniref:Type IV secretory system conjugative DNA transfer family protein n=1 Tax=Methylobacterium nonmethylotrophicum TaxID=1141884 RepID=A0A4Z0NDF6_9HYPH|nr:type IV secretory system conjugative DNA transfer family protein [Methylobacterium nonmethylotrophicum]